jgi:TolB-like protein
LAEVFISYARASEAIAKRVESALKAAGHDAWRDDQLPAHQAYGKVIEQRLRGADAVVVLWSKEAAQSEWVRAEADFARAERKLVQAQLDDALPPIPFNQIQCADLRGWRGHRNHKGWVKLAQSVASVASGEAPMAAEPATMKNRSRLSGRGALAAVAMLLLIIAGAVLFLPRLMIDERPPKIAVLPFESVGGSDDALVEGMWEDTRQALSRNPQLVVLGPNTSEEIARKGSGAAKKAADYLLHASLRTAGNRVRVSTNLTRSSDGAQVWSQTFDRKLDDVFALQSQIAQEIEGRIRGRLAKGGGRVPENITTSGEVYALYSEARATLRRRDTENFAKARSQLQEAVRKDPNFAPAWASLAIAEWAAAIQVIHGQTTGKEAESYARRSIALAPNLADGHAALAYTLGPGPVAEASLRRAVALNPNDVETMTWLASIEASQGRGNEALKLYDRALVLEPLWWPAVLSRLNFWFDTNDQSAIEKELARVDRLGDPRLSTIAHMAVSDWRGNLSEAVKTGLAYYRRAEPSERSGVDDHLAALLLSLGHDDLAWRLSNAPPAAPLLWRNDPRGIASFESRKLPPSMLWKISPTAEVLSRSYVTLGREKSLVGLYKSVASTPDEFLTQVESPRRFLHLAPIIAVALQRIGDRAGAERLLSTAARVIEEPQKRRMDLRIRAILTARIRAAQDRPREAVAALRDAVDRGWWPDAPHFKPDLQEDTAFALLKGIPEFQRIRKRVLAQLAKERAELGPVAIEPTQSADAA